MPTPGLVRVNPTSASARFLKKKEKKENRDFVRCLLITAGLCTEAKLALFEEGRNSELDISRCMRYEQLTSERIATKCSLSN